MSFFKITGSNWTEFVDMSRDDAGELKVHGFYKMGQNGFRPNAVLYTDPNILENVLQAHENLHRLIMGGRSDGLPRLEDLEYLTGCGDWSVYMAHDPCHDSGKGDKADRNTVIAFHQELGVWRIIGRELDREFGLGLVFGKTGVDWQVE